ISTSMLGAALRADDTANDWLRRFHQGERAIIEQLYVDHYAVVASAVSKIVGGSDRDTVIHEVFVGLLERPAMREGFRGGSIAAWLTPAARNRAIDLMRRRRREQIVLDELGALDRPDRLEDIDLAAAVRQQLAAFRATLPPAWWPVFDACFVQQQSQR